LDGDSRQPASGNLQLRGPYLTRVRSPTRRPPNQAFNKIATFPFSGRKVPEYELNVVRQVIEGSYRIVYLIKEPEKRVEVLAVIHTAREGLELLE